MTTLRIDTIPPIVLEAHQIVDDGRMSLASRGASPSIYISLEPGRGELATLLDPPPLRATATLTRNDGAVLLGMVQAVGLGSSPSITLES